MRRLSLHGNLQSETAGRFQLLVLLTVAIEFPGCAGGGASSGTLPPPPPTVTVSVSPPAGNVLLGRTEQLSATVTGSANTAVVWSVNGIAGGSSSVGTISSAGLYTAPVDLPAPSAVQIAASSAAVPSAAGTAEITVTSDISVGISSVAASVELGAKQNFPATITSAGLPDPSVQWTLSGGACPSACGTVDSAGNYTAPQIFPSPATVTLTARSAADPSKQASVSIAITSRFTLQIAAPASLAPSATAGIVAMLTPIPGSNPNTTLHWSLSGPGCSAASCGTLSTVTTQIQGAASSGGADAENASYTAPASAPVPNTITITATPLADPSKKAQATIAVQAGVGVSLLPLSATLALNHRITFAVQTSGTENTTVNWSVNGIPGGSSAVGQICAASSNPCAPSASSSAPQMDYVAPASLPASNPVTVRATSAADATKAATAQVTILNHVVVSVLPGSVTLAPGATQTFSANVLGATNQSLVWQIRGSGCAGAACGLIASSGIYTAPGLPPVPNTLQIIAISADDTAQQGTANVTISSAASLQSLHPASVYAGGALGFVLRVNGGGFALTNPGPGSTLLVGGTLRTTSCLSATQCTAAVSPSDVALPGNVSVQMQNQDGSRSNILPLIVAAQNTSDALIALTGAAPASSGHDIVVVEPTTAGVSVPGADVDLDIAALGAFSVGTNTCSLGGNPIVLARPSTGSVTYDICAFSQSGLDTSMTYTLSGSGDVSVAAKQPAGLGIIHLTLQMQAVAQPGTRTLFIQNLNLDKTAASGVLEVQ